MKRLDKVFAFNVNLFWVRECQDELALLRERLSSGGTIHLFYEANRPESVPEMAEKASDALVRAGFRVSVVNSQNPPLIGLIGAK